MLPAPAREVQRPRAPPPRRPYAAGAGPRPENPVGKTDFYLDGVTGEAGSRERRNAFARALGLPPDMTPNALLAAVKIVCTYEEYKETVRKIGP